MYKTKKQSRTKKNIVQLQLLNTKVQHNIQALYFKQKTTVSKSKFHTKYGSLDEYIHSIKNNASFKCIEYTKNYLIHTNGVIECSSKQYYTIPDIRNSKYCFKMEDYFNETNKTTKNETDIFINVMDTTKTRIRQLPLQYFLLTIHCIDIQLKYDPNICLRIEIHCIDKEKYIHTYFECNMDIQQDIFSHIQDETKKNETTQQDLFQSISTRLKNMFIQEKIHMLYSICI